ncbi:MAG: 3-oxoacyl-[acyl-carrier protein] reductase [Caulobacteraceae bacterium]|nr:3-oxoacyl-[acyl-carrier protein] reductase [Caulobacteraceae bacterium]
MAGRLEGKVALITGGTSGIGEASVELFVAEGARVVFTGRNAAKGSAMETQLGANAYFFQADVRDPAQVKASIDETVQQFGALHVLFNNAGGRTGGTVDTVTPEDFQDAMNLLLGSVVFGMRHAVPIMREQGWGAIINNASVAAQRSHMGGYLYSMAKAAVVQATKVAGVAVGRYGITVNAISPGAVATPIFLGGSDIAAGMEADKVAGKMAKLEGNLSKATPRGVSGLPRDIAAAAVFLASDDARHINCHDLVVDGGMTAGGRTNFEEEGHQPVRSGSPT